MLHISCTAVCARHRAGKLQVGREDQQPVNQGDALLARLLRWRVVAAAILVPAPLAKVERRLLCACHIPAALRLMPWVPSTYVGPCKGATRCPPSWYAGQQEHAKFVQCCAYAVPKVQAAPMQSYCMAAGGAQAGTWRKVRRRAGACRVAAVRRGRGRARRVARLCTRTHAEHLHTRPELHCVVLTI